MINNVEKIVKETMGNRKAKQYLDENIMDYHKQMTGKEIKEELVENGLTSTSTIKDNQEYGIITTIYSPGFQNLLDKQIDRGKGNIGKNGGLGY